MVASLRDPQTAKAQRSALSKDAAPSSRAFVARPKKKTARTPRTAKGEDSAFLKRGCVSRLLRAVKIIWAAKKTVSVRPRNLDARPPMMTTAPHRKSARSKGSASQWTAAVSRRNKIKTEPYFALAGARASHLVGHPHNV